MAKKLGGRRPRRSMRSFDFLEHFCDLADPRQRCQGTLSIGTRFLLLWPGGAFLAGCESWVEIAKFGEKKLDLFAPVSGRSRDGTPSHDQLGDIFAVLDAEQFQRCFHCLGCLRSTGLESDIIAIDGKTLRRSYQDAGAKAPIHMISAWSARQKPRSGPSPRWAEQVQRDHGHPRSSWIC